MPTETGLLELGWNSFFEEHFEPYGKGGLTPARVAREDRYLYLVRSGQGELPAEVSGRLRHNALLRSDFPAVGDWVALRPPPAEGNATIHGVLPRTSKFSRNVAGGQTDEQIVAANVDTVFLLSGLDGEFNPRRIERYLAVAYNGGATPVVVLNKADLCPDAQDRVRQVEGMAPGVAVLPVSATQRLGLEALSPYLAAGATVAMLGSSGVGKSTLINALLGLERFAVAPVRRHDSRGRHATTRREMVLMLQGAVLIDTPGMRELQMWADDPDAGGGFDDVEQLARQCRFRDCGHRGEPGCAVRAAVDGGTLDAGRLVSYRKLKRQLRTSARRQAHKQRLADKAAKGEQRERLAKQDQRMLKRQERDWHAAQP